MSEETNAVVNEAPKPGTKPYLEAELAAAKAELEALKAEKEAMAAAKAEPEAPTVPAQERVELFVEKGYANDEPNQIIGGILRSGTENDLVNAVFKDYILVPDIISPHLKIGLFKFAPGKSVGRSRSPDLAVAF